MEDGDTYQYYLDEKIDDRKGIYIPVQTSLIPLESLEDGDFERWQVLKTDKVLTGNEYLVVFIQHTGDDDVVKIFDTEKEARKYIRALGIVIARKENLPGQVNTFGYPDQVDVHYKSGRMSLEKLVAGIPVNSYTSFETPQDRFSITLTRV